MNRIWFSGPRKNGHVLKPSSLLSLRSTERCAHLNACCGYEYVECFNANIIILCQLLAPVVVSVLREAMAVSPPQETDVTAGMLLKDAAYTAAGHVYYELSNYLNFDEW